MPPITEQAQETLAFLFSHVTLMVMQTHAIERENLCFPKTLLIKDSASENLRKFDAFSRVTIDNK